MSYEITQRPVLNIPQPFSVRFCPTRYAACFIEEKDVNAYFFCPSHLLGWSGIESSTTEATTGLLYEPG
jgi:hypothetical protein